MNRRQNLVVLDAVDLRGYHHQQEEDCCRQDMSSPHPCAPSLLCPRPPTVAAPARQQTRRHDAQWSRAWSVARSRAGLTQCMLVVDRLRCRRRRPEFGPKSTRSLPLWRSTSTENQSL